MNDTESILYFRCILTLEKVQKGKRAKVSQTLIVEDMERPVNIAAADQRSVLAVHSVLVGVDKNERVFFHHKKVGVTRVRGEDGVLSLLAA